MKPRYASLRSGARRSWLRWGGCAAVAASLGGTGLARAGLPEVIAAAKPAVLPVGLFNPTGNPRFDFRGTGFAVGDGTLVVTNFHVLPPHAEADSGPAMAVITSRTSSEGQARRARVVATDRLRDLALLKLEGAPVPTLQLAAAGSAREGQSIALMGFPIGGTLGFSVVSHRGIIASLTTVALPAPTAQQLDARAVSRLREGNFEVLQLDATAYPGNSGGPVVDAETGHVVGVVNQVLVKASRESALSNPTGITYAIPVALVHELLREHARNAGSPPR